MKIHNVGNKNVNLYLIDSGTHRLLVDTGFPDQYTELKDAIRNAGFKVNDINYVMVTHFHIDHAGLVQLVKEHGAKFLLFNNQQAHIKLMETMFSGKKWDYRYLNMQDNQVLRPEESRAFLSKMGIKGEVVSTPGHSADSVSLVLDTGEAFTGDLMPESFLLNDNAVEKASWGNLRKHKVRSVYPGHGGMYYLAY